MIPYEETASVKFKLNYVAGLSRRGSVGVRRGCDVTWCVLVRTQCTWRRRRHVATTSTTWRHSTTRRRRCRSASTRAAPASCSSPASTSPSDTPSLIHQRLPNLGGGSGEGPRVSEGRGRSPEKFSWSFVQVGNF